MWRCTTDDGEKAASTGDAKRRETHVFYSETSSLTMFRCPSDGSVSAVVPKWAAAHVIYPVWLIRGEGAERSSHLLQLLPE